ncbi:hypothetical protein [Colwellia ponticola]|uniref:PepSY domain-containing protein n=1 Tax=Colwellia ponticola TaxID=2304625 RepID=A0A8H2PLD4_9GAMM|nr:hypothetical protein [Colwellia ponticola]TMM43986.1 hypothetical protein FCS21_11290 [Colwellia ponticola]
MNSKRIHQIIGLFLVFPVIGWTLTGIFFFIKPGYQQAYDQLSVKTYPIEKSFIIPESQEWTEVRLLKTILGYHLLVKTAEGFEHLDPITLKSKAVPTSEELRSLFNDSFLKNSERYGYVISSDSVNVITNKGIEVALNWDRLTLRQSGEDTKWINTLYKVHYLQWTPYKSINQYMGTVGLLLLMILTLLGVKIYISGSVKNRHIP